MNKEVIFKSIYFAKILKRNLWCRKKGGSILHICRCTHDTLLMGLEDKFAQAPCETLHLWEFSIARDRGSLGLSTEGWSPHSPDWAGLGVWVGSRWALAPRPLLRGVIWGLGMRGEARWSRTSI